MSQRTKKGRDDERILKSQDIFSCYIVFFLGMFLMLLPCVFSSINDHFLYTSFYLRMAVRSLVHSLFLRFSLPRSLALHAVAPAALELRVDALELVATHGASAVPL